jgi:hypothetical protein
MLFLVLILFQLFPPPLLVLVIPILVAHVRASLLSVHELIGLEGVHCHLLGLDDLVLMLDGCFGCLAAHDHVICHLFVGFELRGDCPLLRARDSILGSGAHIAGQFCEFVFNPTFLTPSPQRVDQGTLGVG